MNIPGRRSCASTRPNISNLPKSPICSPKKTPNDNPSNLPHHYFPIRPWTDVLGIRPVGKASARQGHRSSYRLIKQAGILYFQGFYSVRVGVGGHSPVCMAAFCLRADTIGLLFLVRSPPAEDDAQLIIRTLRPTGGEGLLQ